MSTARLVVAALVLAGLGGLVWWSNKTEAAKKDQPDPKAPPKILELKEDKLRKIEIQHKDEAAPTVLTRDEAGKWSITAPQALAVDSSAMIGLTSAASNLTSTRVVEENATDLAAYGLDPPAISVTFTLDDGSTKRLRIGDATADNSANYAALDGDPRLFTMASYNKTSFDKRIADLREKRLLVFESGKLTSVELAVPGKPVVQFGKTGENAWQIVKPRPMRADGFQVDELVRTAGDARMDTAADPKDAASKFASGKLTATVRLTLPDSTLTLEVRESGGDYYAKSSMLEGAYKVSPDTGRGVSKSVEDFRNKKVFDFGFDEVTKIEVTDKGMTRVIEKQGENWVSGGKNMDSLSVQNLVDKLRDLSSMAFDKARFGAADLKFVVTSKMGQRTETVEIAPDGSAFAARRSDGDTIYSLDAASVNGLREAASGLREAAPSNEKDEKSGKNK
jgi:hypothetical protein